MSGIHSDHIGHDRPNDSGHVHDKLKLVDSVATNGKSQIHLFPSGEYEKHIVNHTINIGFEKITTLSHGHHIRAGDGKDKFNFVNLENVQNTIVGRIEDFDSTRDKIQINGKSLDFQNLPPHVRIVLYNGDHNDINANPQKWLLIKTEKGSIFYCLDGARLDMSGKGGANSGDQEAHFILDLPDFSELKVIQYSNPFNYVPAGFSPQGGLVINDTKTNRETIDWGDEDINDVLAPIIGTIRGDLIAAGLNDDIVHAKGGNDRAWGGDGHDTLSGGKGDDTLCGNDGNDRIFGDSGNDVLMGGFGTDIIYGGRGHDVLYGGNDRDLLKGGDGNDRIFGNRGADRLLGGEGRDRLSGGSGNDVIKGDGDKDTIFGESGNDSLHGGGGNDSLAGGNGIDILFGGSGNDLLKGGNDNDTLDGGIGKDFLNGGTGNDRLIGGTQSDRLMGGAGADTFVFVTLSDSTRTSFGRDTITDFSRSQHDQIDLRAIDANTHATGNQAFHYLGDTAFTGHEGDLSARIFNGGTLISGDVNGDRVADFTIFLDDQLTLGADSFIL